MMLELMVKGKKHLLLDKDEPCIICGAPRDRMYFSWNMFHGEATSACCGAIYQIQSYYIESPSEEEKELLKLLDGNYITISIQLEFIEPIKQALKELGEKKINKDVIILAEKKLRSQNETIH